MNEELTRLDSSSYIVSNTSGLLGCDVGVALLGLRLSLLLDLLTKSFTSGFGSVGCMR